MSNLRKAGVIGWPIHHSRSPLIHGHWLEKHELNGSYDAIAVEPQDLAQFVKSAFENGLAGFNATIPHKEELLPLIENVSEKAQMIGAINTVWFDENGKSFGTNTDADGFLGNLDQQLPEWDKRNQTALILGAGGAARAILFALKERGYSSIYVANRTYSRAEKLCTHFGSYCEPIKWTEIETILPKTDLLVNTTSLGMEGQPPLDLDLSPLSKETVVTDIVYTPLVTPLLEKAKVNGNRIVDGLGMLLHQATPGFELWFNQKVVVTPELRKIIVTDMNL